MKYEITQEQYVDFLNMLTYTQQAGRTSAAPNSSPGTRVLTGSQLYWPRNGIEIQVPGVSSSTPAVYGCDFTDDGNYNQSNDGQNIACSFIGWADGTAYADWSGLRPMTELEFEKACRGHNQLPIPNENVWGSTGCVYATGISNSGLSDETATPSSANCSWGAVSHSDAFRGPIRAGAFATSSSTREQSGATYYGIMEMGGNEYERCVTMPNAWGRAFAGNHGDGVLAANGDADVSTWPTEVNVGAGYRGASWTSDMADYRISDRRCCNIFPGGRLDNDGLRGVRTAP
jgi:formylglycine-generating enzyme required for sulfatase activity